MTRRLFLPAALSLAQCSPAPLCRPTVALPASSVGIGHKSPRRHYNYFNKRLNLDGTDPDDQRNGASRTIFTLPGATKAAVLDALGRREERWGDLPRGGCDAAVILATPRHASWLTDQNFMTSAVMNWQNGQEISEKYHRKCHVLAAVVDGLEPLSGSREMREGISIQVGSLNGLLPGLWDQASDTACEQQPGSAYPGSESACLSLVLRESKYAGTKIIINLPLTNTLFHNGRRTTCLASEWRIIKEPYKKPSVVQLQTKDRRVQSVELPMPPVPQKLALRSPLIPITPLRRIVEGLGNILAKVEIDGEPSAASKEIQVNVPRLLEARRAWSDAKLRPARIGVWALIIPQHAMPSAKAAVPGSVGEAFLVSNSVVRMERLLKHVGNKLAFESSTAMEPSQSLLLGGILLRGGRLHKILSGGGEWGAKASLLSLDPKTSHGVLSEQDELDKFQRSFHGEDSDGEAIARPGDYVQFFVDDHRGVEDPAQKSPAALAPIGRSPYFATNFGVGEFKAEDLVPEKVGDSIRAQRMLVSTRVNHFGACSAEGLYLDMSLDGSTGTRTTTKVDTPGTHISAMVVASPDLGDHRKSFGDSDT